MKITKSDNNFHVSFEHVKRPADVQTQCAFNNVLLKMCWWYLKEWSLLRPSCNCCVFVVLQAMSVWVCVWAWVSVCVCKMPLLAEHVWSDMDAVIAGNATEDLVPLPDGDPGNLAYQDYDLRASANPPALPTLLFEGVNFPEDPIRLLSVQVEDSHSPVNWV